MHIDPIHILQEFLDTSKSDSRISPTHIAMFVAMISLCLKQNNKSIKISRTIVMERASIKSIATYNKCIHDLHNFKYISYSPSFHPACRSVIYFNDCA